MAAVIATFPHEPAAPLRRSTAASFVLHAVAVLLWLVLVRTAPPLAPLTEILIPPDPAPMARSEPAGRVVGEAPALAIPLARAAVPMPIRSAPISALPALPASALPAAARDLGRQDAPSLPATPDLGLRPASAPIPGARSLAAPLASEPGLPVARDLGRASAASLPVAVADRGAPARVAAIPSRPRTSRAAARPPDGVRISGPLGDRALVAYRLPDYPEWARSAGIEATVSLRCEVAADGAVSETVVVEASSGHADLDRRAIDSLSRFRFAPIPGSEVQWGVVTFRFELN